MSRRASGAAVLALSLVVGACGGSTATPTAGPPLQSAAATPTVRPSDTPEPSLDVAPLFVAQIGQLSRGVMTFQAEVLAGSIQVALSGESHVDGPDSDSSTTTTIAGVASTVETIQVAGSRYSRTGDGPWLPAAISDTPNLRDELLRAGSSAFTDAGIELRDGRQVHRLVPSAASSFDVDVILAGAAGVSDADATLVFFADDEGLPVAAELEATWTQTAGGSTVKAEMHVVMEFSQIGVHQAIRIPPDVWAGFTSDRWGYSIAHPADYEYTREKQYDYFFGPVDGVISVSRSLNQGLTANQIARSETISVKTNLGAKSISNDPVSLGGISGRMLTVTGSYKDLGGKYLAFEAIVVKGKYVYFVDWFLPQGGQPAKLAEFMQLVSTFAFTS